MVFETVHVAEEYIEAPDGSEIRPLVLVEGASVAHCTLPAGAVSRPVRHRTVTEVWYFTEGEGQVWRKQGDREEVVDVVPGTCLSIPVGASFQFRATGEGPLRFVLATLPPWPGDDEAVPTEGHWPVE